MTDWTAALCAQVDPDLWMPDHQGASVREARRICGECEVREDCLTDALQMEANPDGVWGGLTKRERSKLRKGAA